ncbi:MAG: hypothetical protein IPL89_09240 [Acidobacteria bacterium]|nr:hypothetical protein [Acidobacteriota bacterium]
MKARTKFLIAVIGLAALFTARPGATFSLVEKSGFDARLTVSQAGFCDGSVRTRIEPGAYDVHVSTFADGSVRATLSQGGVRKGETRAIASPGSNEVLIGLLLPAVRLPAVQASAAKAPAIQLPGVQNKTPTAAPKPGLQGPGTQGTMGTQSSR